MRPHPRALSACLAGTPPTPTTETGPAGFVVREMSRVPFEEYVERNVFAPLG